MASDELTAMGYGIDEIRVALRVIEAEIVGALRQLKELEAQHAAAGPAGSLDQQAAIVHLGEALHEIQQALAHSRREEVAMERAPLHLSGSVRGAKAL